MNYLQPTGQQYDFPTLMIIYIVVLVLLFVSFLVAVIINQRKKFKYQHEMLQLKERQQNQLIEAAVRSEETERHRIAETLHDEVGAILSSAKLHLFGIKTLNLDSRDKHLHEKGKELLDEAIQMVRSISHNLHSNILKEFGLNEAIQHFIKTISKGSAIQASTMLDESYLTSNAENDISIYRLVQELVNNILKHADAKVLFIKSAFANNVLQIDIWHNGAGLTQHQFEYFRFNGNGLGLKNIQNRIILLRGKIEFYTEEEGYNIKIEVPVKEV